MTNLFYLTITGGLLSIFFITLKDKFLKKYGGVWYYYIWILVLVCYCFPYKINLLQYLPHKTQFQQQNIDHVAILNKIPFHLENNTLSELEQNMISVPSQISAKQIICCIYITGFFACLLYYIFQYVCFQKTLKNTTEVTNPQYLRCLKDVCLEMNIHKNVILKKSILLISPVSVGIRKPMILLPAMDFTITDFTMLLKHELTHYKRQDILYRYFALFVHILHWFNPLSYFALCTIQEACEYSCDETVTKHMDTDNKIKYGTMLLNQIQYSKKRNLFFAGFAENYKNKNILRRRIDVIKNEKSYKRVMITLFCIFAVILCYNFFDFSTINANKNNVSEENNVPISINQQFAKTLTEHELQLIYKITDNAFYPADNATRNLTDKEQQRLNSLQNQYFYHDLRPKKELPLAAGEQEFYMDFNEQLYHYPERELTDEELLQLIDWRLKVNYALSLRNTEQNSSVPGANDMTESEAIAIAKQNIENLFNATINELQISATFYQNSNIQPDGWFIRLYPKGDMPYESNWNYAVWISRGDVETVRSSQNYQLKHTQNINNNKEQILNDKTWLNKAKAIVEQQGHLDIQSISFSNTNFHVQKNSVDVKVVVSDGYYMVSFYYPDQSLKGIAHIIS